MFLADTVLTPADEILLRNLQPTQSPARHEKELQTSLAPEDVDDSKILQQLAELTDSTNKRFQPIIFTSWDNKSVAAMVGGLLCAAIPQIRQPCHPQTFRCCLRLTSAGSYSDWSSEFGCALCPLHLDPRCPALDLRGLPCRALLNHYPSSCPRAGHPLGLMQLD